MCIRDSSRSGSALRPRWRRRSPWPTWRWTCWARRSRCWPGPERSRGLGRDADALAYLRDAWDYRNLLLVEQPNGDFAHTMLRQFLFDSYAVELWSRLATSTDATLAGIAGKAVKESAYHVGHSGEWVIRLGDGTTESARRTRDAVADLWEFTGEQ